MDFTPSVYEHAAFLIGRTPWDTSRDPELMLAGHAEAFRRYRHTPVVVGIDIYNLEAEAYGGLVQRPSGNGIPAIGKPICRRSRDLTELRPLDPRRGGRIPMVIDVARRLARQLPEADVRVPLSGPFSIASNLVGFETLLSEVITHPQGAAAGLMALVDGQVAFARAIHEAGLDVAFFESAAAPPLLSPATFRHVELPALKATLNRTSQVVGHPVPCIMGGDTTPVLDALLETGTNYLICPCETDQQAFMQKVWGRTEVRVRINTSPEALTRGPWEAIRAESDRILRIAAGRPNVCVGTGALPYETPPQNVLRLAHYLRDK